MGQTQDLLSAGWEIFQREAARGHLCQGIQRHSYIIFSECFLNLSLRVRETYFNYLSKSTTSFFQSVVSNRGWNTNKQVNWELHFDLQLPLHHNSHDKTHFIADAVSIHFSLFLTSLWQRALHTILCPCGFTLGTVSPKRRQDRLRAALCFIWRGCLQTGPEQCQQFS